MALAAPEARLIDLFLVEQGVPELEHLDSGLRVKRGFGQITRDHGAARLLKPHVEQTQVVEREAGHQQFAAGVALGEFDGGGPELLSGLGRLKFGVFEEFFVVKIARASTVRGSP